MALMIELIAHRAHSLTSFVRAFSSKSTRAQYRGRDLVEWVRVRIRVRVGVGIELELELSQS